MENKELQEVVDIILQALLEMEERFNKKFDEIDKWFDKIESKKQRMGICPFSIQHKINGGIL